MQDAVQTGLPHGLWLDRENAQVRPDICILDVEGNVVLQTNGLGLRGPDVEAGQRIGVVWGDSVVWGTLRSSWPEKINDYISGCTFLNGGIEGFEYTRVLERAIKFNELHDVRVNVVFPGWHPVGQNSHFRSDLIEALGRLPNALLLTMPTSLNPSMVKTDISSYFTNIRPTYGDIHADRFFGFFGAQPYSIEFQEQLFRHVCERNDIIRNVAGELKLPVLDLFQIMESSGLERFNEHFFDMSHPRPKTHAMIAQKVAEAVAPLLHNPTEAARPETSRKDRFTGFRHASDSRNEVKPESRPLVRLEKYRLVKNVFAPAPQTHNAGVAVPDARLRAWSIRAPGPQWSYAASWSKIGDIPDGGPIVVEIDAVVDQGKIGFGLVAADESYVGKEAVAPEASDPITVALKAGNSSRIRYLVLRNVDDVGETAVARVLAVRAYAARYVPASLCILYQPEKTGSQTVESSIIATDEEAIVERHHFLSSQTLNKFDTFLASCVDWNPEIDSYRNQARLSRLAAELLERHEPSATYILTGIRDPLDRAISAFFQHITFLCPDLTFAEEQIHQESTAIISRFTTEFEAFLQRRQSNSAATDLRAFMLDRTMQNLDDWMQEELTAVFGVDASRMRFPKNGLVTFAHRQRTFFVYKVEALGAVLPGLLQALPLSGRRNIVKRNLGEEKPYAALYKRTREEFVPTAKMMNYYYENSAVFSRAFRGQRPAFVGASA